jgi:hypothetical protein
MRSKEGPYIVSGIETERTVSLGTVIRAPESSIDKILRTLDTIEGVRVIYQKVALYELFITPCPPSRPNSVSNLNDATSPERNTQGGPGVSL